MTRLLERTFKHAAVISRGTVEEPVNDALHKTPQGGKPKHQCQQIQGNQQRIIRPDSLPDDQGKRGHQAVKYHQGHPVVNV